MPATASGSRRRSCRPTCGARSRSRRFCRSCISRVFRPAISQRRCRPCSAGMRRACRRRPSAVSRTAGRTIMRPGRSVICRPSATSTSGRTVSTCRPVLRTRSSASSSLSARHQKARRNSSVLPMAQGKVRMIGARCCSISNDAGSTRGLNSPSPTAHVAAERAFGTTFLESSGRSLAQDARATLLGAQDCQCPQQAAEEFARQSQAGAPEHLDG